jgi:protein-L-isoaspartate O-methyltransferase
LRGRGAGRPRAERGPRWDAQYTQTPDLFELEDVAKEDARYAFLLEALSGRPLGRTLEVGCSVGVLTAMLAERSASLMATDISEVVLERARERLRTAGHPDVEFRPAALPDGVPEGPFDTILAAEVLYYLPAGEVAESAARLAGALAPSGRLLVAHTRGYFAHHVISADRAAALVARTQGLRPVKRWSGSELRVDLFERG